MAVQAAFVSCQACREPAGRGRILRMKIAMITAGGAGMFCGSCMQDNTLIRALRQCGADAMLIPTYTPIRVDEENVSSSRVFLGGINVYLDSAIPGWRFLPARLTHWLNRPGVIRLLTRLSSSTDASQLGGLTVDLLRGDHGPQHREIRELTDYLCNDLKPDVILLTNVLLSGIVPQLRRRFDGTLLTMLQGDDIFLDGLTSRYQSTAIDLIRSNCQHFDGILTHSRYYSQFMQRYLTLPADKFHEIPLTLDSQHVPTASPTGNADPSARRQPSVQDIAAAGSIPAAQQGRSAMFTIGYFARICPEKGVHRLLDALSTLLPKCANAQAVIAGFLPRQHHQSFQEHLQSVRKIVGGDRLHWAGSPDSRNEKLRLLQSFDVLCVPTTYREPKGLYVLEAALCGVPSVVPAHGAFPERIAELGFGDLYAPDRPGDLERILEERYREFSDSGTDSSDSRVALKRRALETHSMESTGPILLATIQEIVAAPH